MFKKYRINTFRFFTVIAIMILIPSGLMAQQGYFNHQWYFGTAQRDLRFNLANQTPSVVTNQNPSFGQGGSAVATDPLTGTLLFYTDGVNIYDATHVAMPGGSLMGTSSQNQPVAICQVPGQEKRYYVFTRQGTTLRSTVVDMTLAGNAGTLNQPPLGALVAGQVNILVPGVPALSEAMIIIPHSNNNDFWLIAHEQSTTNYVIIQIATAPAFTVTTVVPDDPTTPTVGDGLIQNAASFSYYAPTKKIAVAPREANRNVEVLTFSETGPSLTTQIVANSSVSGATTEAIFDTEFSNSGKYLYVSRHGNAAPAITADVIQYDIKVPTNPPTTILSNNPARSYGLQMAPDSTIYHLYQQTIGGPFRLGALTRADSVASATRYNPSAFAGDFSGRQFPNFALHHQYVITASFTSTGTCANAPTSFFPTVTPDADSLVWNFGDNSSSSSWSPVHTYTAGGLMRVTMTAFVNGQTQVATQQINITDVQVQITLPSDTTACMCELNYTKSTNPPSPVTNQCAPFVLTAEFSQAPDSWTWFSKPGTIEAQGAGSQPAELAPDSAGYYFIVAQVGACQIYQGVNIKEHDVEDQRANIWYFGNQAGLNFNEQPVVPISNPVMNAPEGTSTMSDRNGQVIIFTDGRTVWGPGPTFTPITDLSGAQADLGGSPNASQSAIIVPVPDDETLFYIFTTKEVYGAGYQLNYALFDRKKIPFGQIIEQGTLFEKSTERITASASGWLIAHEFGSNAFRAYRVSNQGIGNPVTSGIGSDHTFAQPEAGQGYMKLSPNNILAVALAMPPKQSIEMFDFIDSTGVVTNYRVAKMNDAPAPARAYGVEFQNDRMFATLNNGNSSLLYEWFIDSLGMPHEFTQQNPPAPNTNKQSQNPVNATLGAIQLGPDGQIYVAVNGAGSLGRIQVSGDTTRLSTFTLNGQTLGGKTSTLGLPNFIQSITDPPTRPSLGITGFCLGDPTVFTASGSDNIDELTLFINGISKATGVGTAGISYEEILGAGQHTIRLLVINHCQTDPVLDTTTTITINLPPKGPLTPQTLCTPPLVLNANPPPPEFGLSYQWSTGDTTRLLSVSRVGTYSVSVTSRITGCTTDTDVEVLPGIRQVNFGPDPAPICSGTITTQLNTFYAPSPDITHQWLINGVDQNNNTAIQNVNLTTAGVYTYIVMVNDALTGCFTSDTIQYTINTTPVATLSAVAPIACNATNGQLMLNITEPAGSTVEYEIVNSAGVLVASATGISVPSGMIGPINGPAPGLGADTYTVIVTGEVSRCQGGSAVTISTSDFTVTPPQPQNICDPSPAQINVSATGSAAGSYFVTNTVTGVVFGPETKPAGTTFNTMPLSPGSYSINVTINGCSAGANFVLGQKAIIAGDFTADNCAAQPIAVATPAGMNYLWSGVTTGTTQTVNLTSAGNATVTISDPTDNQCPITVTKPVNPAPLDATFDLVDRCVVPLVLNAVTPTDPNITYLWRNVTAGNTQLGLGQQFVIPGTFVSGNSVDLFVRDVTTGCTDASQAQSIRIPVPFTVTIVYPADPPCENSRFILEAQTSITDPTFQYRWFLNNTSNQIGSSQQIPDAGPGLYIVQVTDNMLCVRSDEDSPVLLQTDAGDLDDRGYICPYPEAPQDVRQITLAPGTSYIDYKWFQIIDGIETELTANQGDPTYTATVPATYRVELRDIKGCNIEDEIIVIEECEPIVTGPTAFRPSSSIQQDGEMVNQNFRLFSFFIEEEDFSIYIFNRWGEMIFASNETDFRWNGGYKNNLAQLVPAGTYSYVVRYKSRYRPEDGVKEKRGSVVLVR